MGEPQADDGARAAVRPLAGEHPDGDGDDGEPASRAWGRGEGLCGMVQDPSVLEVD